MNLSRELYLNYSLRRRNILSLCLPNSLFSWWKFWNKYKNKMKNKKKSRKPNSMPFLIFQRDHLRSNLRIISGPGIICGRGSFAALYRYVYSNIKWNLPKTISESFEARHTQILNLRKFALTVNLHITKYSNHTRPGSRNHGKCIWNFNGPKKTYFAAKTRKMKLNPLTSSAIFDSWNRWSSVAKTRLYYASHDKILHHSWSISQGGV